MNTLCLSENIKFINWVEDGQICLYGRKFFPSLCSQGRFLSYLIDFYRLRSQKFPKASRYVFLESQPLETAADVPLIGPFLVAGIYLVQKLQGLLDTYHHLHRKKNVITWRVLPCVCVSRS